MDMLDDSRARVGLAAHHLQRALSIIDARLDSTIHVRDIAEAVNLSPFHFARMFKKSTGQSPHAYLTRRRMELAMELLAGSKIPLGEVATRTGYHTQAHFTDAFRRYTGTTPGRYRRENESRVVRQPMPVPAASHATATRSAVPGMD